MVMMELITEVHPVFSDKEVNKNKEAQFLQVMVEPLKNISILFLIKYVTVLLGKAEMMMHGNI